MTAVEETSTVDGWAWQQSWDRQQEGYMLDREHRFTAMLDVVEAVTAGLGRPPRVLDLAGGTGSISLRLLRRRPDAQVTLVDLDPVLLRIARATLPTTVAICPTDLRDPAWDRNLPHDRFDAVLTATAMHWLTADRLAALYREVHDVLGSGGVFVNADHMPDEGLPTITAALGEYGDRRRAAWYTAGAVRSWRQWWEHVAADPVLGPLNEERARLFNNRDAQEWLPAASWHEDALRDAGFAEVGLIWRGGTDAAVAGRRATDAG